MSWRDLLQKPEERLVAPWVGGRSLRSWDRAWAIVGRLPREHGWYDFSLKSREATLVGPVEAPGDVLRDFVRGYLVGDRLIPDGVRVPTEAASVLGVSEQIHLVERGLGRFVRVSAGRTFGDGPLIYSSQDFPLGPEDDVLRAFQDGQSTVLGVSGVAPALDAAFRFEVWRREEADRIRREEQERREREEQERAQAERREQLRQQMGTGQGRREMALVDFKTAAEAALRVGGAQYLDHLETHRKDEMRVQYMVNHRRFECVCHVETLRIIDAGICLVDHRTGVKGDTRFTLESLPVVVAQAERDRVLVVFRHVD